MLCSSSAEPLCVDPVAVGVRTLGFVGFIVAEAVVVLFSDDGDPSGLEGGALWSIS